MPPNCVSCRRPTMRTCKLLAHLTAVSCRTRLGSYRRCIRAEGTQRMLPGLCLRFNRFELDSSPHIRIECTVERIAHNGTTSQAIMQESSARHELIKKYNIEDLARILSRFDTARDRFTMYTACNMEAGTPHHLQWNRCHSKSIVAPRRSA